MDDLAVAEPIFAPDRRADRQTALAEELHNHAAHSSYTARRTRDQDKFISRHDNPLRLYIDDQKLGILVGNDVDPRLISYHRSAQCRDPYAVHGDRPPL